MTEPRDPPRLTEAGDPATRALRDAIETLRRELLSPETTAGVLRGVRRSLEGTHPTASLATGAKGVALKWLGLAVLAAGVLYGTTRIERRVTPPAAAPSRAVAPLRVGSAMSPAPRVPPTLGARFPVGAAEFATGPGPLAGQPVQAAVGQRAEERLRGAGVVPPLPDVRAQSADPGPALASPPAVSSPSADSHSLRGPVTTPAVTGLQAPDAARGELRKSRTTPNVRRARAAGSQGDELVLLRAAQAELARNPVRARALLARHAELFCAGSYAEERAVLVLDALTALGKMSERERAARAFLRAYPRSMYAAHVRALLEAPQHPQ